MLKGARRAIYRSVLKRVAPYAHARLVHRETRHSRLRRYLAEYIPPGGVGAEVGVFWGHFAEKLAVDFKPSKLYLVDPWDTFHGEFFRFKTPYTMDGKLPTAVCEAEVRKIAARHPGVVEVRKDYSTSFFEQFPDEHFDWVYLDATHYYEGVMADLRAIWPKLKKTGILFGDDYFSNPEIKHHGVWQAVNDFAARRKLRLIEEHHYQYLLLRRGATLPDGLPRPEATKAGVWPTEDTPAPTP